jgi:hypothetical protein
MKTRSEESKGNPGVQKSPLKNERPSTDVRGLREALSALKSREDSASALHAAEA